MYGEPLEFMLDRNIVDPTTLSMEECVKQIIKNKDLITEKVASSTSLGLVRSAIVTARGRDKLSRTVAYAYLYNNFIKDLEEQQKQVEKEQQKQFLDKFKDNSTKEETEE